jgi:hypothetical protein
MKRQLIVRENSGSSTRPFKQPAWNIHPFTACFRRHGLGIKVCQLCKSPSGIFASM